jgi:hypothetical protein
VLALVLLVAAPIALAARKRHKRRPRHPTTASLYTGPVPRPGPAILYSRPALAPQLTNTGVWRAAPILVSGATAYRRGEFLYQDWLYDDHGAHLAADALDPRSNGDSFSKPNGTYSYPTGPGYVSDAADLVEFRAKPLVRSTAFRVTLNTLENPSLIAFSIAIGGKPGQRFSFPDGANVVAPASMFLTVHPAGSRLVADLVHARNGKRVRGPRPRVRVDRRRRQITVLISHRSWNPRRHTVRLAMGIGLWDKPNNRYLLPQLTADATHPGGAGTNPHPAAFFNVAFRSNNQEPMPSVTAGLQVLTDPRWWRDAAQGAALAGGDISPFSAKVNFAKLLRKRNDNSKIPRSGPMDRILASHFEPGQGADFAHECGLNGATNPSSCVPEYRGQLEPYQLYVPPGRRPRAGWGMTLLLHSLSANYNQYMATRNQSQFAQRAVPSLVITPEARGPDQFYQGLGAADVFEVWADVARSFKLSPAYTEITGYSMGGVGTFDLGSQFPDLFARAQPTVGSESDVNVLASLRNVPVLMWNVSADELVNVGFYTPAATKLDSLGYRVELDVFQPCASTLCSPVLANHLELAINDQFAPAAAFLDTAQVDRNPAHVTYVVDPARDRPQYGVVGDHAYWVSGLTLRGAGEGQIDAQSHGFAVGDPAPSGVSPGVGSLTGGNMGTLTYTSLTQTWGATPAATRADSIDIHATNIAAATINVARAHVDCNAALNVTSDGPLTVTLPGCHRVVTAG